MGRADTGLPNNPSNNDEVSPNRELDHPVPDENSDSDIEESDEDRLGHYVPLSQNPNDGEPFYESDDEIFFEANEIAGTSSGVSSSSPLPDVPDIETILVKEVWSKPAPMDIELSEKKIDLVKEVMLNIKLPCEAIPDWARNIPEEEWKDHLLARLNKNDSQQ